MENIDIRIFDLEEYLPLKILEAPLVNKKVLLHKAVAKENELIENWVDYIQQNEINKELGDAGEEFICEYKRECIKKYNLPDSKQVKWVSKDVGDGFGYDILSYDSQGNEIYIEVKTTLGNEKSSFYITANELLKSEQEKERYFLYRVYNFDMKTRRGEISVRRGSLRDLCIMPQVYKVKFE